MPLLPVRPAGFHAVKPATDWPTAEDGRINSPGNCGGKECVAQVMGARLDPLQRDEGRQDSKQPAAFGEHSRKRETESDGDGRVALWPALHLGTGTGPRKDTAESRRYGLMKVAHMPWSDSCHAELQDVCEKTRNQPAGDNPKPGAPPHTAARKDGEGHRDNRRRLAEGLERTQDVMHWSQQMSLDHRLRERKVDCQGQNACQQDQREGAQASRRGWRNLGRQRQAGK